jgi:sigma-E factor negative regulatory protein RseC
VYTNTSHYSIGQQVTVSTSSDAVKQALLIGFGLPLLLLSSVLVTAKMCGSSDGWAALLALGVLFPYYIFVWLIKDLIAKRISFNIE